jgi:hypothetical protein
LGHQHIGRLIGRGRESRTVQGVQEIPRVAHGAGVDDSQADVSGARVQLEARQDAVGDASIGESRHGETEPPERKQDETNQPLIIVRVPAAYGLDGRMT